MGIAISRVYGKESIIESKSKIQEFNIRKEKSHV